MINMQRRIVWTSLLIFFVGLVFAVWFLLVEGGPSRSVRTIQLMLVVLMDFDVLEESDVHKLVPSIETESDSLVLNRKVAAFLKGTGDSYVTNSIKFANHDGLYCDAWGRPLWFASTNSPVYARLNPEMMKGKPTPFVVWSSGPNGTNDFGFIDDLFLHR